MFRFFILNLFTINLLFAHPHTFIDIFPKINYKDNSITTINFEWKFDVMTSQLLSMEFDLNMDGIIDDQENQYIFNNYFETLGDYGFYTDIRINKNSTITKPLNFKTFIDNEQRIVYSFDVELNAPKDKVYIDFYDEENFTAFVLKKEFITSKTPFKIVDVDNDFYFAYRLEFKE